MANNYDHLRYCGQYQDESFLEWFIGQDLYRRKISYIFRRAVLHQTSVLREELREEILMDYFVLDHHPVTFSALKWVFLKLKGFTPYDFSHHHITVNLLRDWQCFHGALAEYRVVTKFLDSEANRQHIYRWSGRDMVI